MEFFTEIQDIMGNNPTVTPKVVLSSTDGLKLQKQKQVLVGKRNLAKSSTEPSSASACQVTPNQVVPSTSTDDPSEEESDCPSSHSAPKRRKVRNSAPKREDLVAWLGSYKEQQKAAESERMELARAMHTDNMAIMAGLLDIMKQAVSKK